MLIKAGTVQEYIAQVPEDRRKAVSQLRSVIKKNLPKGFSESVSSGMLSYSVPHSIYPPGYHCTPEQPLPFLAIASQKHFIALYHMGLYGDPKLLKWFTTEFPRHGKKKLDMSKSCIRFKKPDDIPFELVGELASKMSPQEWIECYEKNLKR
jgi:uncharacterized protein YdhG (YjbR/CyaY superfamily)